MAKTIRLTKRVVDELPRCAKGQALYYDAELAGFGLRVGTRSKAYFAEWRVAGRTVRTTIGKHGPYSPESARRRAFQLLARMQQGVNPVDEARKERARGVTLKEAFEAFLVARKTLKPNSIRDYKSCFKNYFHDWHDVALIRITRDMVAARHSQIGKRSPARANLAMRFLRALFNFALTKYEPHVTENPVRHLSLTRSWYRIERRRGVIRMADLAAWYEAVMALQDDHTTQQREIARDYFLLVLFTGLRRQEAASLRWANIDLDKKTLTVLDTKNNEPHVLPLTDFLVDVLLRRQAAARNEYVFPGPADQAPRESAGQLRTRPDQKRTRYFGEPRKQILRVCSASGVHFRIHDLRRTFLTVAESLDISAYALKRLANHKLSNDVTAGYIISDVERLRAPMQAITDHLCAACAIGWTTPTLTIAKAA